MEAGPRARSQGAGRPSPASQSAREGRPVGERALGGGAESVVAPPAAANAAGLG